jgi:poly(3-hydroxybutyrate) depolymerase
MRSLAIIGLFLVMAAGCGEAADESAAPTTASAAGAPASSGCEVLHEPGEYEGVGHYGDVEQPYWMLVPATYVEIAPAPLYVHLAAAPGDHDSFAEGFRPYLSDLEGLMLIVNTETAPRGQADALASLVDQVSNEYCVDSRRVHVMGTSHSFHMAENFACDYSDRVASFIAALGGVVGDCRPERPVPLLTFTGDDDRYGVQRLVAKWVEINGCDRDPVVEDLGSGVRRKTYQNCAAGILFYDIEGMGHAWPLHEARGPAAPWIAEYDEVDYYEEAYKFFADHPLP